MLLVTTSRFQWLRLTRSHSISENKPGKPRNANKSQRGANPFGYPVASGNVALRGNVGVLTFQEMVPNTLQTSFATCHLAAAEPHGWCGL